MIKIQACVMLLLLSATVSAQRFHLGVFGGVSAYNGDLADKIFPKKVSNGAIGITGNYELTDHIMLRGGLTYTVVGGADRFSSTPDLVARNLSFETSIVELSAVAEYYLLNLYETRFSPYVYAGIAGFRYDPYAYSNGEKVYLKPLSTEGQGLPGYTHAKPYSLTQIAIPFGAGVKYAFTQKLHLGLEASFRKLFTDYLDDVSTRYADPADLLAARGQQSVELSYRGDEVPGGEVIYPTKDAQRGGSKYKDWYYFAGLHLTYRLGGNGGGLFGGGNGRKGGTACPVNVY